MTEMEGGCVRVLSPLRLYVRHDGLVHIPKACSVAVVFNE